jgi:hypothetical protein
VIEKTNLKDAERIVRVVMVTILPTAGTSKFFSKTGRSEAYSGITSPNGSISALARDRWNALRYGQPPRSTVRVSRRAYRRTAPYFREDCFRGIGQVSRQRRNSVRDQTKFPEYASLLPGYAFSFRRRRNPTPAGPSPGGASVVGVQLDGRAEDPSRGFGGFTLRIAGAPASPSDFAARLIFSSLKVSALIDTAPQSQRTAQR